jgi:hypothetical protein
MAQSYIVLSLKKYINEIDAYIFNLYYIKCLSSSNLSPRTIQLLNTIIHGID